MYIKSKPVAIKRISGIIYLQFKVLASTALTPNALIDK